MPASPKKQDATPAVLSQQKRTPKLGSNSGFREKHALETSTPVAAEVTRLGLGISHSDNFLKVGLFATFDFDCMNPAQSKRRIVPSLAWTALDGTNMADIHAAV